MTNEPDIITKIDNYEFACINIVAFDKIFIDLAIKTYQGKKLKTSSNNKIHPNGTVTPDLVFESNKHSLKYKAVNEIKSWLPLNQKYWIDTAKQLKKYDDELSQWEFADNFKHDIMLTVDPEFSHRFQTYTNQLDEQYKIKRHFIILESSRKERRNTSIFIKKQSGTISNNKLDKKLSDGMSIPLHAIVKDIDRIKFYDSEPPITYMMFILWDHIFSKFATKNKKDRDDLNHGKIVRISLEIDDVKIMLQKFTHDTNPNCIQIGWIFNALNQFVHINMAERIPNSNKFTIKFKKLKGTTQEKFVKLIVKKQKIASNSLDRYT